MTFDYCASLGAFPFRRVPDADAEALLRLMDEEGIAQALVSSLEAVLYRNVQAANELLVERIASHADRLLGAAVINPAYPRATEDTALCLEEMGLRAVRLLPSYHAWRPTDPCVAPVLAMAAHCGVPVSVMMRVEDDRQRHPLLQVHPPTAAELATLFAAHPNVAFVLERANAAEVRALLNRAPQVTNWSVELSGKIPLAPDSTKQESLFARLGPDRWLFGTDLPLQYPRVAQLRLAALDLAPAVEAQIRWGNAQRLLTGAA
ncbi:MAG: amidohydrolase family protein [Armatimonadetes bacterium]|nr:amidohydrolase family protein [Armatimonadota bacterium]